MIESKIEYRIIEIESEIDYNEVKLLGKEFGPGVSLSLASPNKCHESLIYWGSENKQEVYEKLEKMHNEYQVTKPYFNGKCRDILATEYFVIAIEMIKTGNEDWDEKYAEYSDTYDYTPTQEADWCDFYDKIHGND